MTPATAPRRHGKNLANGMIKVAAILLVAGRSTRFAATSETTQTKLAASLAGKPLARYAAEAAVASSARPVIAVSGHARTDVEAALSGLPLQWVHNARFAEGLASSLQSGLAVAPDDVDGVLILLGDMPAVTPALIDRLIGAFAAKPDVLAVAPVHAGQRGNPILLARGLFAAVAKLDGDIGARRVIDALPSEQILEIPVGGAETRLDVDTRDALAAMAQAFKF
jgi:molybdenum cofactor cytidylyltransferase